MSHVICIAGESGTGKTTSMRNLDPNTTLYIDCDKKGLSWKGWIIRELSEEAKKFEAEKKRLEARQTTLENRVKLLKDNLFFAMKETGKTKFKTDLFSFGIQRNGGVQPIEIIPDIPVPAEYCRMEPNITTIRKALESGKNLPFAHLLERGEHLRIR